MNQQKKDLEQQGQQKQQKKLQFQRMSLKKSQDYLYFQNKASHYHNISTVKPRVDTKLPQYLSNTIDYYNIKPSYKHEPHLRQFDIEFQNKHMLKRILAKQKSPINRYSTYSRFNEFQRSFRKLNPQQKQQQRLIQLQNQKLRKSIQKAKSLVGSVHQWKTNYDQNVKHSRLKSKFNGTNPKDSLIVQTQKFLPEKYIKYIENIQQQNLQEDLTISSRSMAKAKIQVQKLFILPQLNTPRMQQNLNNSKVLNSQTKSIKQKQRQIEQKSKEDQE